MMKWLVNFIDDNKESWARRRKNEIEEAEKEAERESRWAVPIMAGCGDGEALVRNETHREKGGVVSVN